MLASEPTRAKLVRLVDELRAGFAHLPAAQVERTLFVVAEELLSRANFEDFVPLLAHRQACELFASSPPIEPPIPSVTRVKQTAGRLQA